MFAAIGLAAAVLLSGSPQSANADMSGPGLGVPIPGPGDPGYTPQPPLPPPQPNAPLAAQIGVSPATPTVGDIVPFADLAFSWGWDWYLEDFVEGPPVTITSSTPTVCEIHDDEETVEYVTTGTCELLAATAPAGRFTRVPGPRAIRQLVKEGLPISITVFDAGSVERTDGSIYVGDRLHLELPAAENRAYRSCKFTIRATWGDSQPPTDISSSLSLDGMYGVGCSFDVVIPDQVHPTTLPNVGTITVQYSALVCNQYISDEDGGCANGIAKSFSLPSFSSYIPNSYQVTRHINNYEEADWVYYMKGFAKKVTYRFGGTGTPRSFASSFCATWTTEAADRFRSNYGGADPTCEDYPNGQAFSSWNPRDIDSAYPGFFYNEPIEFSWDTALFPACNASIATYNSVETSDGSVVNLGGDRLTLAHVTGECPDFSLTLPGPLPATAGDFTGYSTLWFGVGPLRWNEYVDLSTPATGPTATAAAYAASTLPN